MVCAWAVAGLYVLAQLLSPAVPVAVRPQLGALKVPLPGGRLVTPKVTEIGRAAGRGREEISVGAGSLKKKVPPGRGAAGVQSRMWGRGGDGGARTTVSA